MIGYSHQRHLNPSIVPNIFMCHFNNLRSPFLFYLSLCTFNFIILMIANVEVKLN